MPVSWPSLNAASRARDLDSLARCGVDLLVVGGGVTGAGIALDAASRGLRVALVERGDLAQGTSRWSSKLVHGGLRYLAHGDIRLARDSARERAILMTRTAPHLIRALPFMIPATVGATALTLGRFGTGAGDLMRVGLPGGAAALPRARWVGRQRASDLVPGLRPDARGGVVFWDGQLIDDARLVLGLARTAATYGASILTRMEATSVGADGAELSDRLDGGRQLSVEARAVVNATGVWAGELANGVTLRPSRGSHLVLPSSLLGFPRAALTVPLAGSTSRYVFALPQLDGRTYLGHHRRAGRGANRRDGPATGHRRNRRLARHDQYRVGAAAVADGRPRVLCRAPAAGCRGRLEGQRGSLPAALDQPGELRGHHDHRGQAHHLPRDGRGRRRPRRGSARQRRALSYRTSAAHRRDCIGRVRRHCRDAVAGGAIRNRSRAGCRRRRLGRIRAGGARAAGHSGRASIRRTA